MTNNLLEICAKRNISSKEKKNAQGVVTSLLFYFRVSEWLRMILMVLVKGSNIWPWTRTFVTLYVCCIVIWSTETRQKIYVLWTIFNTEIRLFFQFLPI